MSEEIWSWALRGGVLVVGAGLSALLALWVKNSSAKTWLQKALGQLAVLLQGFASDVTTGMTAAINSAAADGKVTKEERAALVAELVRLLKASASARFLAQLQQALGIGTAESFESWLRGMAGQKIDDTLTQKLLTSKTGSGVQVSLTPSESRSP